MYEIISLIIALNGGSLNHLDGSGKLLLLSDRSGIAQVSENIPSCIKKDSGSYDCSTAEAKEKAKKVTWIYGQETKEAWITAYNSVPNQTDSKPCEASSGVDVCERQKRGYKTCAGNFPYGTRISVPGWGVCDVLDRTAGSYKRRIDLYFGGADQITAARQWGIKKLPVTIIYAH